LLGSSECYRENLIHHKRCLTGLESASRPRTYLVEVQQCTPKPPDGLFGWVRPILSTSDERIMRTCGLDAFLFLRYLTVILKILLPITFIVTPTLGCLNYFSGERSLTTSFDQLSITNVASTHVAKRMWAHWTVCIIVVIRICYVLHHEILAFVKARHTYLRSRVGSTNAHLRVGKHQVTRNSCVLTSNYLSSYQSN
jgi:hypothetical protein